MVTIKEKLKKIFTSEMSYKELKKIWEILLPNQSLEKLITSEMVNKMQELDTKDAKYVFLENMLNNILEKRTHKYKSKKIFENVNIYEYENTYKFYFKECSQKIIDIFNNINVEMVTIVEKNKKTEISIDKFKKKLEKKKNIEIEIVKNIETIEFYENIN